MSLKLPSLLEVRTSLAGAFIAGMSAERGCPSPQIVINSNLKPYLLRRGLNTSLNVRPLWATTVIILRDGKSTFNTFEGTTSTSWPDNTVDGYFRLIIWKR